MGSRRNPQILPTVKAKFSLHLFLTLPNVVKRFDKSVNRGQLSNTEQSVKTITSRKM